MSDDRASTITKILEQRGGADGDLLINELLPHVYEELRELARRKMIAEPAGHTLAPTALVHEAYLRLLSNADSKWENRRHFFGAAAEAMRRILVERARRVHSVKRGGSFKRVDLDQVDLADDAQVRSCLDLDAALDALERQYPKKAEIVKLRYYAGLSVAETASTIGLSEVTVMKHWRFARAWLLRQLDDKTPRTEPLPEE
ncbi:MAG: ECF-type sigma factor [Planctomycetota bacterium]